MALLEADVNYKVAKDFVESVRVKAEGQEVWRDLKPHEQVVKIVYDELVELMGGTSSRLVFTQKIPNVVMVVGLQGSGKTTSTGKISRWLKDNQERTPLLVSVDVYRPAAREQLKVVANAVGVSVYEDKETNDPMTLVQGAMRYAQETGFDTLMIDTAGRLHIDDDLMVELQAIADAVQPTDRLYVADAMTGQDAIKSAGEFHRRVGATGVVLTKMDGDARGGAALSVVSVVGVPIAFVGSGERLEDLEPFLADRVVSRVLGMGDVLTLIEKAEQVFDQTQAAALEQKIRKDDFTLEDFREQLRAIRKMGPLESILGMLPGMGNIKQMAPDGVDERQLLRVEAIIGSMTPAERRRHDSINGSRRKRIARGSGTSVEDVNRLLKQFVQMKKMLKVMGGGTTGKMYKRMGQLRSLMR